MAWVTHKMLIENASQLSKLLYVNEVNIRLYRTTCINVLSLSSQNQQQWLQ